MKLHEIPPSCSHSGDTFLALQYTQRAINRDYRTETGKHSDSEYPPELDGSTRASKIPPMMVFDNFYGHFADEVKIDKTTHTVTRVFDVRLHSDATSWYKHITESCKKSINRLSRLESDRYCWDIEGTVVVGLSHATSIGSQYPDAYKRYARTQKKNVNSPLSVHTVQAWLESSKKRGRSHSLFKMISVSTTMTCIAGGIGNNLTIEMGFEEENDVKDLEKRKFDDKYLYSICIGSTPHNADAGKVRRLTSYTRGRVLSSKPLWSVENVIAGIPSEGPWVVHCMGSVFETSDDGVSQMVKFMKEGLRTYYRSQFDYGSHYYLPVPPTFMVYHKSKVLDISIAPGVVVKGTEAGDMGDSSMILLQKPGSMTSPLKNQMEGGNNARDTHNPYYLFFTYPNEDQQPRPAFANSQTVQCQGLPWGPANARISPNHVSNTLISTKFGRMVEQDHLNNVDAIWDILPGEDVVVCFLAMPLNHEDSILVSQKFADLGGFSNMSVVPVRLREREDVPEVGERICGKKYKWWKVECTSTCICQTKKRDDTVVSPGRAPTGIVQSVKRTEDGGISVHILSFAQFTTGDKLGSLHGQKGLCHILPHLKCPIIITSSGQSMTADVYISPASVVARQTHGMAYESGAAWRAARDGRKGMDAIFNLEDIETETCKMVLHPDTCLPITRINRDTGEIELSRATYGMVRLIAQTQTTREKHHLTHNVEGKYSLNVVPGRGSGGGVSRSEMDAHVAYGNGTTAVLEEVKLRENTTSDYTCMKCFRIMDLCECGTDENWVTTRFSSGLKEYDVISACLNGSANTYVV